MKVKWLRKALRNLESIHNYISKDNPEAASRLVNKVREGVQSVSRFIRLWDENALIRWFNLIESAEFRTFDELRSVFPSADLVDDLIVFNIGGNKYRLITSIHFNRQKVYIRYILTHSEYDKDKWKT